MLIRMIINTCNNNSHNERSAVSPEEYIIIFGYFWAKFGLRPCSPYTVYLSVALRKAYPIGILFTLKMNIWA